MDTPRTGTIRVNGARLTYQVAGSGPPLLLIPGGPMDAGAVSGLRDTLAERYTVISYDPRGLSASTVAVGAPVWTIGLAATDAHQLLTSIVDGPAFVLGIGGGGLVGLALARTYGEQVRMALAVEPPCVRLLSDADEQRAVGREVYELYRTQGVRQAMARFLDNAGAPSDPEPPEANADYFLGNMSLPTSTHLPDVIGLRSLPVSVAVGADSAGTLGHRTGTALATQLGFDPVVLHGRHDGEEDERRPYADRVHAVFADA